MRTFLYCEAGFVEKDQWLPNSWINVECPTAEDIHYLTNQFNVPESFLSDIADTDERPRIEYEGNWLLTIIRIPVQSQEQGIPFTTIPLGIMTNNEIIISVCYYKTELIPDFIRYTRRKEVVVRHKYDLILRLIHSSAVWFLKYLKQINNEVAHAEKSTGKEYPQRRPASPDEVREEHGLLQHLHPWQRSDAQQTAKHFPGTGLYGQRTGGRCGNGVETGAPHGQYL